MKTIIKIVKHQPDDKCISVKICRLHSHKSIDEYKSKRVNYSSLDLTNNQTFTDSLSRRCSHRIESQDENLEILSDNIPEEVSGELDIDNLIGKVIESDVSSGIRGILPMRRVNL